MINRAVMWFCLKANFIHINKRVRWFHKAQMKEAIKIFAGTKPQRLPIFLCLPDELWYEWADAHPEIQEDEDSAEDAGIRKKEEKQ